MADTVPVTEYILNKIQEMSLQKSQLLVCEIGCGDGSTSMKITSILRKTDTFYYMDYYNKVRSLREKLTSSNVTTKGYGNGRSYYDSYAWNIAKIYLDLSDKGLSTKIFDLVYLDASNIFIHDCSACSILKKMMKPGGLIIINNTSWSFSKSKYWRPTNNEETLKMMSKEQSDVSQDDMVCKIIFDSEFDYKMEYSGENYKVYKYVSAR